MNGVARASSTYERHKEGLRGATGAANWEITTKRSPEFKGVLAPTSLSYMAEETPSANEQREGLVFTEPRQGGGMERAVSILSKINWSPEVTYAMNSSPKIKGKNGIRSAKKNGWIRMKNIT